MFGDRKHPEAFAVATALYGLLSCDPPAPPLNVPASVHQGAAGNAGSASENSLRPTFIEVDITHLYQVLLLNGLSPVEKSQRWAQFYRQRFVRWTGRLARIQPDALLFVHIEGTGTYDVLLKTARTPGQPIPKLQQGRFYNYIGRLERYDDGFQTLYLEQGVVREAGLDGVPGTLATAPPMTRKLPQPPKSLPGPPPPPQ